MAWIILEGLDRSGKSTAAEFYQSQGYKYIHMDAPDKKYFQPGYCGPGYVDEMLEICMENDGRDVVFDRSWWGEIIWPDVFGRRQQLDDDELEALMEFEASNDAKRILMTDPNTKAHWQRCVDNDEPLTKDQFRDAARSYMKLVSDYGFKTKTLHDFKKIPTPEPKVKIQEDKSVDINVTTEPDGTAEVIIPADTSGKTEEQRRLEAANAINTIMSSKIIKRKGEAFDQIENEIRGFLNQRLGNLLGSPTEEFSQEEIVILRQFCTQMKTKLGGNK